MHTLLILTFLTSVLSFVNAALRNITIDDTDPSMVYSGNGWMTLTSTLLYNGSHHAATDKTAKVTYTFTGVAIYYLASKWAFPVSTELSLDNGAPESIDLTDQSNPTEGNEGPPVDIYSVVWSQTGLANTEHTLIDVAGGSSTGNALMDGVIITVDDSTADENSGTAANTESESQISSASDASTSSSPSSPATSSPARSTSSNQSSKTLDNSSTQLSSGLASSQTFPSSNISPSSSVTSQLSSAGQPNNRGKIVGAIVGALVMVVVLSAVALICIRRRSRHRHVNLEDAVVPNMAPLTPESAADPSRRMSLALSFNMSPTSDLLGARRSNAATSVVFTEPIVSPSEKSQPIESSEPPAPATSVLLTTIPHSREVRPVSSYSESPPPYDHGG